MSGTASIHSRRTIVGVGVLSAGLLVASTVAADNVAGERPACINIHPYAWNGGPGWNHLVTVTNHCDYAVHCSITTNANPAPTLADVPAGGEQTVNTYLYNPLQGFQATANCARQP